MGQCCKAQKRLLLSLTSMFCVLLLRTYVILLAKLLKFSFLCGPWNEFLGDFGSNQSLVRIG